MSPLNISTLQDKLFKLNENIKFIEDIVSKQDKDIQEDVSYYALEHILQLSIQIILDIGSHILAEEFQENPATYAEVITALGKNGIIDPAFAESQGEMAKFRNRLIHDYDNVDRKKVIAYAKNAPGIFRAFGASFTKPF